MKVAVAQCVAAGELRQCGEHGRTQAVIEGRQSDAAAQMLALRRQARAWACVKIGVQAGEVANQGVRARRVFGHRLQHGRPLHALEHHPKAIVGGLHLQHGRGGGARGVSGAGTLRLSLRCVGGGAAPVQLENAARVQREDLRRAADGEPGSERLGIEGRGWGLHAEADL